MLKIVILLLLASPLGGYSQALASDSPKQYLCVQNIAKNDKLNVRAAPNMTAKILTKLNADQCQIENLGERMTQTGEVIAPDASKEDLAKAFWIKIKFGKKAGWAALTYLKEP